MKVGLLGHGVVGSGVRKIVDAFETDEVKIGKILVKDVNEITDERMTNDVEDVINDATIDVVVECMGGIEPAFTYAMRAMRNGKHFVTSNKKMFASKFEDLYACAKDNHVSMHFEASCGGGIPWMANLARIKRIDAIQSFSGIFNGTTNYILSNMFDGDKPFSQMLLEAQKLGYAEKNPTDDIDGYDVRYKVALSCLQAFDVIVLPDMIPTFGIRHVQLEDIAFCKKNGYVMKLIGQASYLDGKLFACVMPMLCKDTNVLSSIPLNFNAITSNSTTLGPATFIGQGAGSLPTAHAVVQDVVDIVRQENMEMNEKVKVDTIDVAKESMYYVRTNQMDVFSDVIAEKYENAFVTKKISFQQLLQRIQKANDASLFVGEVEA